VSQSLARPPRIAGNRLTKPRRKRIAQSTLQKRPAIYKPRIVPSPARQRKQLMDSRERRRPSPARTDARATSQRWREPRTDLRSTVTGSSDSSHRPPDRSRIEQKPDNRFSPYAANRTATSTILRAIQWVVQLGQARCYSSGMVRVWAWRVRNSKRGN